VTTRRVLDVLRLAEYNTRIVMFGVVALGIAGGVVGVFLLLRRRALLADAVSHASLPGVASAFLLMRYIGGDGRSLPGLLTGALVSGLIGMACVVIITRHTKLSQDAALGIVLSVFFGFGVALLGIIQKMRGAQAAGLNSFIYGKTASMIRSDALIIGVAAVVVIGMAWLLFKEFRLLTFDPEFAGGDGWPVGRMDLLLMTLVVAVTVLGLQTVGIILIIAILIIPATAARFWTDTLRSMVLISGAIGALGAYLGTAVSAFAPGLPAGSVIVVALGALFLISLLFGHDRGLIQEIHRRIALEKQTLKQNLLRAMYECEEEHREHDAEQQMAYLTKARGWTRRELDKAVRMVARNRLVYRTPGGPWSFTEAGRTEAARVTRNHRLWEVYLLEHAHAAASRVDSGADYIEHVLGDELVAELEQALPRFGKTLPPNVHRDEHRHEHKSYGGAP
jgi:manganese/zinc/iron transport system permease protein